MGKEAGIEEAIEENMIMTVEDALRIQEQTGFERVAESFRWDMEKLLKRNWTK